MPASLMRMCQKIRPRDTRPVEKAKGSAAKYTEL